MAKAARKRVAEAYREAFGADLIEFSGDAEESMLAFGVDLNDLDYVLLSCKAYWNNKEGVGGIPQVVVGTTTEENTLYLEVWIDPNTGIFMVETVSLTPGATGDAEPHHEQTVDKRSSANDR